MKLLREPPGAIAIVLVLITSASCAIDNVPEAGAPPVTIGIQGSCADCLFERIEFATLGSGAARPTVDARVASNGDSLIAVAPLSGTRSIGIFRLDGTLLRTIALPAAWKSVAALEYLPNGELMILSELRNKLVQFSADGRVIGEMNVPANTHRFASTDGMVVVNAEIRTRDALGFPLHLLSQNGSIERSFGSIDPMVVPRADYVWRRRLARHRLGGEDGIWSVNPDTYQMELWSVPQTGGGQLLKQITRGTWWDSVSAGSAAEFATERPRGEVIAVWEDSTGLLWTQLKLAAANWRPISGEELDRRRNAPFRLSEYDEFFETVIEVLDPAQGNGVASTTIPGVVGLLLEGGIFAKWVQTGEDEYALRLTRLSLIKGNPR